MKQAFSDSNYGDTKNAREQGGYIWADKNHNIMITRVPAGKFSFHRSDDAIRTF